MNERMQHILNHKATIPAAVGVLSFGVGVAIGYLTRKKKEAMVEPYEQLKFEYPNVGDPSPMGVSEKPHEPKELYEDGTEYLERLEEVEVELEPDPLKMVRKNIFNDGPNEGPHTITEDDFFSSDLGYTKRVYTYFSGDDVMTDEEETPIYGYEKVVGPLSFGKGTNDPWSFFARNHQAKSEYQVVKDEDSYSEMVLGIVEEDY